MDGCYYYLTATSCKACEMYNGVSYII